MTNRDCMGRTAVLACSSLAVVGLFSGTGPAKEDPARVREEAGMGLHVPSLVPMALPKPTVSNLAYGPHPRQVLDFWQAPSSSPTPLVIFIHGGGWYDGDKSPPDRAGGSIAKYRAAGISVVAINYRFIEHAEAEGIVPPVKAPLHDAVRAVQFVRSKAAEWNINPQRIGVSGGSAGACSGLWLAYHDDLADPLSPDPIARESTRVWCAGLSNAQTTLDPQQMVDWTPNSEYGAHAFGIKADPAGKVSDFNLFVAKRAELLAWIAEYSPYALVTPDDPPVYIYYSNQPALGQKHEDPTHAANFGVKLQEKCKSLGIECELAFKGIPNAKYPSAEEYLIAKLRE